MDLAIIKFMAFHGYSYNIQTRQFEKSSAQEMTDFCKDFFGDNEFEALWKQFDLRTNHEN